jgi:hypothetical protein
MAAGPVFAEDAKQLDAHEHGVGELNIAFDGNQIAMEFHAPGADIVGFEYGAESAQDKAAVEAALVVLSNPLELFEFPAAAGCTVVEASAQLESEDAHAEDHDEHAHDEHHEEHKDEHKDDEHAHEDHKDAHADEAGHTEFHAEYALTCTQPVEATEIKFAYFAAFPNALEVEVQVISDKGATAFEVERDAPTLDLSDIL